MMDEIVVVDPCADDSDCDARPVVRPQLCRVTSVGQKILSMPEQIILVVIIRFANKVVFW